MNLNQWEYTILLVSCFIVPFLYSIVHRRLLLRYHLHIFQPTILIAAVPFIAFDMLAVWRGYWYFNPRHITGLHIFNLPVEEYLFFILIPQSCLLIWIAMKRYTSFSQFKADILHHFQKKKS